MKISKQRLKEIIREELLIVRESQTEPGIDSPIWRAEPLGAGPAQPDLPSWEGDPFGEYDLEAENAKGFEAELARRVRSEPDNASFWQKILAAVEKANIFPRTEGLGEPRDTPPGDGFGDNDDGYPPERPPPKSWVDGKPPKPPAKEGKVSSHRSEVTYSKEKRGKSKKPEKKAYNKADRAQAKRDLKK
jgi:hypothetical protein